NKAEVKKIGLDFKNDFAGVDCIIITTKERDFINLDWKSVASNMSTKAVVDTQNVIDNNKLKKLGFSIRRIGYAI
ncbi:MAG: UDP binding domain-containing protein, partial [Candidatus Daviesbacteria bacterium]|nr:UDP binding domain-containing protein [Candidatus Daviesbacteria bacterium]